MQDFLFLFVSDLDSSIYYFGAHPKTNNSSQQKNFITIFMTGNSISHSEFEIQRHSFEFWDQLKI